MLERVRGKRREGMGKQKFSMEAGREGRKERKKRDMRIGVS